MSTRSLPGSSATSERLAAFVRENLAPEPVPFARGLRYYAALPDSGLRQLAEETGSDDAPYWAFLWPGGAALIHHLRARPDLVRGRTVADFGCGAGLAGIAALKAGATHVTAVDREPMALIAAQQNAALNRVRLDIADRLPPADVVLAGDVFYGDAVAAGAFDALDDALAAGATVLLGDIDRGHLPHHRLERLGIYKVRDVGDGPSIADRSGGVYRLLPPARGQDAR